MRLHRKLLLTLLPAVLVPVAGLAYIAYHLVVEVDTPLNPAELWRDAALTILTSVLMTACLVYAFLRVCLVRPLTRLRDAAREVGNGHLVTDLGISSGDEIGELVNAFESMSRKLEQCRAHASHLAYHDSLTDLPNRRRFSEQLDSAIALARRRGEQLAVLFIDLDGFKRVNDALGHNAGDSVLTEVAGRLSGCLRDSDYIARDVRTQDDGSGDRAPSVARLGGDEFIVLVPLINDRLVAGTVSKRILKALREPMKADGQPIELGASIGISVYPQDGDTPAELIRHADLAMYDAKARGKNRCGYFRPQMDAKGAGQMDRLSTLGDDRSQGYLYSAPLTADRLETTWLRSGESQNSSLPSVA